MSDDNNKYTVTGPYFPPQLYYSTTNAEAQVGLPERATDAPPQRKRKYTRSKTGCMTCRVKKVKCDESKPICLRCTHGARECSWPEATPTRKRTPSRRDSIDEWFSTSELVPESTGLSESPSSSGREQTPPYRSLAHLVPIPPRSSDSYESTYESTYSMNPDHNARSIYPQQNSHSFPITSASHYTPHYDFIHPDSQTVPCTSIRQQPLPQANPACWTSELDTYYYNHRVSLQENILTGLPSPSHDHPHYRYYQ